jgi:hypothetical protein
MVGFLDPKFPTEPQHTGLAFLCRWIYFRRILFFVFFFFRIPCFVFLIKPCRMLNKWKLKQKIPVIWYSFSHVMKKKDQSPKCRSKQVHERMILALLNYDLYFMLKCLYIWICNIKLMRTHAPIAWNIFIDTKMLDPYVVVLWEILDPEILPCD